jgi:hypothetical protein
MAGVGVKVGEGVSVAVCVGVRVAVCEGVFVREEVNVGEGVTAVGPSRFEI